MRNFILIFFSVLTLSHVCSAQMIPGEMAKDFTLSDLDGVEHRLSDAKGKFVVLEWFSLDCLYVDKHYNSQNMQALQKETISKGMVWYTIVIPDHSTDHPRPLEEIQKYFLEKHAHPSAILIDTDHSIQEFYGVQATPEIFIINPSRFIVYHGAIDSIASEDPGDIQSAENYVRAALQEAQAGQDMATPTTPPYGCPVEH